jgi:hypothetical protein
VAPIEKQGGASGYACLQTFLEDGEGTKKYLEFLAARLAELRSAAAAV